MQSVDINDATIKELEGGIQLRRLLGELPDAEEASIEPSGLGPQAFLVEYAGAGEIPPHFHPEPQFQVVVSGEPTIGKHAAHPVSVHYTDGFTPYGPIRWGDGGLKFFNFRADVDFGAYLMPESRQDMKPNKAGRTLVWDFDPSVTPFGESVRGFPQHRDGLQASLHTLRPDSNFTGPDPEGSGCQFYLVLEGSVRQDRSELDSWSCAQTGPGDPPATFAAGTHGARILLLQFPRS